MTGTVKKKAKIRPVIVAIGIVLLAIALRYLALEGYERLSHDRMNAAADLAASDTHTEAALRAPYAGAWSA